jgi:NADPH:quinone reductase-like Zn-dependent oxidoreductase
MTALRPLTAAAADSVRTTIEKKSILQLREGKKWSPFVRPSFFTGYKICRRNKKRDMDNIQKYRAVQYDKFGGIDVLHINEIDLPAPGIGQVLVRVKAAGINPGESTIRNGVFAKQWPSIFPSGQGSDFAGIVERVGEHVEDFKKGDEVIGFTDARSSQAEYVLAEEAHLVRKPEHVPWEQAGSLFVVGTTGYAAVKAVALKRGDILVVSGAAGGVGSVVVQLAVNMGAKVIGIASEANHGWLSKHGIIPISYGMDLAARIKTAAGGHVDAFIDCYGQGYVDLALQLGVATDRIDTIIDFEAAKKYKVKTDGNSAGAKAEVLAELANLVDKGRLEIPIARVYPLDQVRKAYEELEKRHTHGKIVLVP